MTAAGGVPWLEETRSSWLRQVQAWVAEALTATGIARAGALEEVRARPWSIVLRTRTEHGFVYFKAAAPGGRHEAALLATLARRWADRVPTPLACDVRRGWMLLPDLGPTLREALDGADGLETWQRLLPRYAEIQIASADETSRWLELGVPDRRLDVLPGLLAELLADDASLCVGREGGLDAGERASLDALLPEFSECCSELGCMPNATTLDHGDLHDGNVLVGGGSYRLFDWGDSSVTHPFVSLLVTCNTQIDDLASDDGRRRTARLRDAYLEPWTEHTPGPALRELFAHALWVAHVSRALDWNHILAGTGAIARSEWQPRVATWLRLWRDRRALLRGA